MQILNLIQGSPEWKAARAEYFTASEAPAMKGSSPYKTRDELLHEKKTGETKPVDEFTQKLFDKGHRIEALARPIAEKFIGDDLYPVVGAEVVDGLDYLASFDGLTMDQTIAWECKSWNEKKAEIVRNGAIPPADVWQVVQQLKVSGAKKCLYTVTDGTPEKTVHVWAYPDKQMEQELYFGWNQFNDDLLTYEPAEPKTKGVSGAIMELPAIQIEISGGVKSTNLAIYKKSAEDFIASINTDLVTDDDFATAETTVKFCDKTEKKLAQVKESAIDQTADISELFKTIDFLQAQIRSKRLSLSNDIKNKKAEIKREIIDSAIASFVEFSKELNGSLGGEYVLVYPNMQGATKNKRTIDSLETAASDEIANCKVKATMIADKVRANLNSIPKEYDFLFSDKDQIVTKEVEDFVLLVGSRVDQHKKQEAEKAAALAMEQENADAEGEKMSVYPDDEKPEIEKVVNFPEMEPATVKSVFADDWKIVAESLKKNGIGIKSANKIARLIVDDKIDNVKFFTSIVDLSK